MADALAAVPGIREALHSFGPDDVPDVTARPLAQFVQSAVEANEHCTQARYALAGRDVGAMLTELSAHADNASAGQRGQAAEAAVLVCFVAGVVASRTGHPDLAVASAQRGYELARRHGDPAEVGFARWYWGLELTSVTARDRAHAVAAHGIDELTPSVRTGHLADTRPAEVVGLLHLQQARTAARARSDDAAAHLTKPPISRSVSASATRSASTSDRRTSRPGGYRSVSSWAKARGPLRRPPAFRSPLTCWAVPSARRLHTWTSPARGRRMADLTTPMRSGTWTPPTASRRAAPVPTRLPETWSACCTVVLGVECGSWTRCATASASTSH